MNTYKEWWDAKEWTGPWTLWQLWLYNNRRCDILERYNDVCRRRARELSGRKGLRLLDKALSSVERH